MKTLAHHHDPDFFDFDGRDANYGRQGEFGMDGIQRLFWYNGGNTTTYTITTGSTTGLLKNYATGANTAVTATITVSDSGLSVQTAGAETAMGTDAYNTFHGFANMAGVVNYSSTAGWYMDVTFTGLDPAKIYTFATSANRAGGSGGIPPTLLESLVTRFQM